MDYNIYVGRNVYYVEEFTNEASYHGHILGCDIGNSYYNDEKLILLEKKEDDKYYYMGTDILCNVVSKLDNSNKLIGCHECMDKDNYPKCFVKLSGDKKLYGVMDVRPIFEVINASSIGDAITSVIDYNNGLDKDYSKRLVLRKKAERR